MTKAEYMRQWRAKNREAYRYNLAAANARVRALNALARAHPDQFDHLLNVERALDGLPPVGIHGRPQYATKRRSPETSDGSVTP
jgi:hypothetical protein